MRIIIAGGRDFDNYELLVNNAVSIVARLAGQNTEKKFTSTGFEYIVPVDKIYEIVSGCAKGADQLGEKFAKAFKFQLKQFPADWDKFGKSAGYKRNEQMALYAKEDPNFGVLIAFWDGKSKGTKHMIDLAYKHGLKVFVVNY
jgi:hypothetical protein